ncbi:MAG: hypothetical protein VXX27_10200 [Pseudomonadota bacterium]|nr:hypothetical protein [Pseudomonadota bacterium]
MGLSHSLAFWLQTPFFCVVFGVLMLGLEMINRRLIYFLTGSLAAMTLAILLLLSPTAAPFWPLIAIPGVDEVVAWVAMTVIATPVFMRLRRVGRRRRRHRRLSQP